MGGTIIGAYGAHTSGGGGGGGGVLVKKVNATDTAFPTKRADGTSLKAGDYVEPEGTLPFTLEGITFKSLQDKAEWNGASWIYKEYIPQDTLATVTNDAASESISGEAANQKAVNVENKAAIEQHTTAIEQNTADIETNRQEILKRLEIALLDGKTIVIGTDGKVRTALGGAYKEGTEVILNRSGSVPSMSYGGSATATRLFVPGERVYIEFSTNQTGSFRGWRTVRDDGKIDGFTVGDSYNILTVGVSFGTNIMYFNCNYAFGFNWSAKITSQLASYEQIKGICVPIDYSTMKYNAETGLIGVKPKGLTLTSINNNAIATSIRKAGASNDKLATEKAVLDAIGSMTVGRLVSLWDCSTGMPSPAPSTVPFTYNPGDYFIIKKVAEGDGINFRPSGLSYTGAASTVQETEQVQVADFYYFNESKEWVPLVNGNAVKVDGETIIQDLDGRIKTTIGGFVKNNEPDVLDYLQTIEEDTPSPLNLGTLLQEVNVGDELYTVCNTPTASFDEKYTVESIEVSEGVTQILINISPELRIVFSEGKASLISTTGATFVIGVYEVRLSRQAYEEIGSIDMRVLEIDSDTLELEGNVLKVKDSVSAQIDERTIVRDWDGKLKTSIGGYVKDASEITIVHPEEVSVLAPANTSPIVIGSVENSVNAGDELSVNVQLPDTGISENVTVQEDAGGLYTPISADRMRVYYDLDSMIARLGKVLHAGDYHIILEKSDGTEILNYGGTLSEATINAIDIGEYQSVSAGETLTAKINVPGFIVETSATVSEGEGGALFINSEDYRIVFGTSASFVKTFSDGQYSATITKQEGEIIEPIDTRVIKIDNDTIVLDEEGRLKANVSGSGNPDGKTIIENEEGQLATQIGGYIDHPEPDKVTGEITIESPMSSPLHLGSGINPMVLGETLNVIGDTPRGSGTIQCVVEAYEETKLKIDLSSVVSNVIITYDDANGYQAVDTAGADFEAGYWSIAVSSNPLEVIQKIDERFYNGLSEANAGENISIVEEDGVKRINCTLAPDGKTIVRNSDKKLEATDGASFSDKSTVILNATGYISGGHFGDTWTLPNGRCFVPGEKLTIYYNGGRWDDMRGTVTRTVKADGTIDSIVKDDGSYGKFTVSFKNNTVSYQFSNAQLYNTYTTACKITAAFDCTNIKPHCIPVDLVTIGKNLSSIFLMDGGVTFAKLASALITSTIRAEGTATDNVLPTEAAVRKAIDSGGGGGLKKISVKNPALHPTEGIVTWTITHELGSAIIVQIFSKDGEMVSADVVKKSATEVAVSWVSEEDILENAYEAIIIG